MSLLFSLLISSLKIYLFVLVFYLFFFWKWIRSSFKSDKRQCHKIKHKLHEQLAKFSTTTRTTMVTRKQVQCASIVLSDIEKDRWTNGRRTNKWFPNRLVFILLDKRRIYGVIKQSSKMLSKQTFLWNWLEDEVVSWLIFFLFFFIFCYLAAKIQNYY